jgi:polysaccharide biosynthesis protein PslH
MEPTTEQPPIGLMVVAACPLPEISGGRKRTARLLDAMQRAGLTPHVLSIGDDIDDEAAAAIRNRGWVAVARAKRPRRSIALLARQHAGRLPTLPDPPLVAQIRALAARAAVVHFEEIWALQHILDGPFGPPLVASVHNIDSKARASNKPDSGLVERVLQRYRTVRMAALERRATRTADVTVCVSEADRRHFEQLGARRTMLVANGIDEDLLAIGAPPSQATNILFFGQLAYRPNVEGIVRFIQAGWPQVRAGSPDAVLRVVGPNMTPEVTRAGERADGVEVVGLVPDLTPELAAARAVLVPIRFGGGTRLKVLEAMAAARPVVGTALGVEELGFADGRHGFVRESDGALAEGLLELLRDPALADRQGAAGRELAERFAWTRVAEPLAAYYAETARRPVVDAPT